MTDEEPAPGLRGGAATATIADLPACLADRITVDARTGCWIWTARIVNGYAQVAWEGRYVYAHRLTYQLLVNPTLPLARAKGEPVSDHLCRRTACVNPAHIELVTQRENTLRGDRSQKRSERYVGIQRKTRSGRWQAKIQVEGRVLCLGHFGADTEAAVAYDDAAELHYGERTNERLGLLP